MNSLNKIILTGLSVLSLNNLLGQNTNLDSFLEQPNIQLNHNDSLLNMQSRDMSNFLNQMKMFSSKYSPQRIYSENLLINLNDGICYLTNKNEEQGIEDIRKINNGCEEAWLYLPKKQTWYEIGIFSDSNSVKPLKPLIKKILKENPDAKELIFYHNHPGEGYNRPSTHDLELFIEQNFDYLEYKITGKIVADRGIVEYSLNSNKEKLLKQAKKNPIDIYRDNAEDINKYFNISLAEYEK